MKCQSSNPIDKATTFLSKELESYREILEKNLDYQSEYITDIERSMYSRGKLLRPILLLLSAKLNAQQQETLPEKVIQAAVSLEMIHVASLIHDDIIDASTTRRGCPSISHDRGIEIALLIGDMQFLQAIRGFTHSIEDISDLGLVRNILNTGVKICAGEIDELRSDPHDSVANLEKRYFNIIDKKTALLFGTSCEVGSALVNARSRNMLAMGLFGRKYGQAFQIMDDINDFSNKKITGKGQYVDLQQKRLSLPIIYAMEGLPIEHALMKALVNTEASPEILAQAITHVLASPGFIRAYCKARGLMLDAIDNLHCFPECESKSLLMEIANYTINQTFI